MEKQATLGLDISKRTIAVCLLFSDGKKTSYEIANSPAGFQQLLGFVHGHDPAGIHVCMEPTGKYSNGVSRFLHGIGYRVSLVNSRAVLNHGRSKSYRSKNDRIDAYLLADYAWKHDPPAWTPISEQLTELRQIEARIAQIDEMIRQEENRIEAGIDSMLVLRQITEHIANLQQQKLSLDKWSKDVVQGDPTLKSNYEILCSIISIGDQSARRLLALIRFEQFEDPRHAGCFTGLTPRQYKSGTSIQKRECISRVGNSELRRMLYFPAMSAIQHNPQMASFAARLRAKGKPGKVIICAVMRKMIVLATALIRRQELYDCTRGLPAS